MLDIIKNRRCIRTYIDKPVEKEKIIEILRAGMQAPSSKNSSPWEFVIIDDKKLLQELSKSHHKAIHIKDAPICIVVLGNRDRFLKPGKWMQDLGACWVGIYPKKKVVDKVKNTLNLPERLVPYALVPIGYSEEKNIFIDKFDENKIHRNMFE